MNTYQLNVDFSKIKGKIKAMHGVGQPPWTAPDGEYLHFLTEAHIPYSRLHDMGGAYGGMVYVDIPNIFRNFEADENDPASYDFAFTDVLISKLMESGVEPIYRLGVTIENYTHIRRYNILPPPDFEKWARICEHVIRHYTEGWANGYTYSIKYWEIWNEPDNNTADVERNPMWYGTPEEYFALYATASKHLKACFGDKIRVGGYASCGFAAVMAEPRAYGIDLDPLSTDPILQSPQYQGFVPFFYGFLSYIREHHAPLDFFSWHSYLSTSQTMVGEQFVEKTLDEYGYGDAEIHLNEWNNAPFIADLGTSYASARAAATMLRMQKTRMTVMCYYDARMKATMYGGLFHPLKRQPVSTYYSFQAFGELYTLGNEVECECEALAAVGAVDCDGTRRAVMLVNVGEAVCVRGIPADMKAYLVDADHFLTETPVADGSITLAENQVVLLKNE